MTLSRTNGTSWGVGDKFTSAQANGMDIMITNALDKRSGQTDVLSSIISCAAGGRVISQVAAGPDANSTLTAGVNANTLATGLTAARVYTLSGTGAVAGDSIYVFNPTAFSLLVNDGPSSATLVALGTSTPLCESPWATFLFNGSNWILESYARFTLLPQSFTANGNFTAPRLCSWALLIGYGAGGGGGGATPSGSSSTTTSGNGGGGGGGAQLSWQVVPIVAGTVYPVVIGTAGAGGAASANGGDGGNTTFGSLATFCGAGGGTSSTSSALAVSSSTYGGAPVALNPAVTSIAYQGRHNSSLQSDEVQVAPGSGGRGFNAVSGFNALAGTPSAQGFVGGAGGVVGSVSTALGGGGGGGGGGGPGGIGGNGGAGGNGTTGAGLPGTGGNSPPTANSGAGGGGGGAGGSSSGASGGLAGVGFAGGAGQLTVIPLR